MKNRFFLLLLAALPATAAQFGTVGVARQAGREARDKTLETPPASPAYFVDASLGDDGASGSSSDLPWKTLARVSASPLPSGAVVYLKRGEIWNEQLTVPSSGFTLDAYGTGAAPKIDGSRILAGWTSLGSGLYSQAVPLSTGEALGNLSENGTLMAFVPWNTDPTTTFAGQSAGTYAFDFALSTIYIKPAASPAGSVYRASVKIFGVLAASKSNIVIRNIHITRFSLNGVLFENCRGCSVSSVEISDGGGAVIAPNPAAPPTYIYAGNGVEFDTNSSEGSVTGVSVFRVFDSGISPQTFHSNNTVSGIDIRDSTIDRCGFAGVEISVLSNGGTTGSSITDVTVSGVLVANTGRGWSGRRNGTEGHGIRVMADDGAGTMSGIRLERCTISNSIGDGVRLAGNIGPVTLHRMNIQNNDRGISVEDSTATSLSLILTSSLIHRNGQWGLFYNSPTAAGLRVFQNTFFSHSFIQLAIFNQAGEARIQNNIFHTTAPVTHLYSESVLMAPMINNNCYTEMGTIVGYNGTPYSLVTSFHSETGFEMNGVGGDVDLTNPIGGDFSLQATSDCRGLGATGLGVTADYIGGAFASPPSSGALEYR
ncbi:MAG: right-handed parallel beta-helix repeat-containing protein [Elusimicrobia bacterium]|nr:right-handed parallel beta-helix repeat-containing protein [Elusimicrobiota bacterium]